MRKIAMAPTMMASNDEEHDAADVVGGVGGAFGVLDRGGMGGRSGLGRVARVRVWMRAGSG